MSSYQVDSADDLVITTMHVWLGQPHARDVTKVSP